MLNLEPEDGSDQDLPAGTEVGEYRLQEKLGEGGFGAVYRAVHAVIGKVAAVKILQLAYSSSPQMVSRFVAEARAVNQIRHKNIIDIFAFGRLTDGRHYFVMELLEGESLQQLLSREGRLPVERALKILRPVARALDAAHAAGIAHRDLKPDNVFLAHDEDSGTVPKLLDFGIAKLLDSTSSGHKTETGTPIGTPHYMSPEQCRGLSVDQRTDVYSFGILTYRILTGELPFDARTSLDVMFQQIHQHPRPVSMVQSELPDSFDEPIAAMLAKEPVDRPESVETALDALAQAAAAAGFPVDPVSGARAKPPSKTPRTAGNDSPRVITGSKEKLGTPTYAEARTLEATPTPKTLGASEQDVRPPSARRSRIPIMLGLLLAIGAGVLFLVMRRPAAGSRARETAEPSAAHARRANPPIAPSAAVAVPAPADPESVVLHVHGAPPRSEVFLGDQRLGSSDEALQIPFGREPLELSLRPPKGKPAGLVVTPDRDQTVTAPERPVKTPASRPRQRKEYENPF